MNVALIDGVEGSPEYKALQELKKYSAHELEEYYMFVR